MKLFAVMLNVNFTPATTFRKPDWKVAQYFGDEAVFSTKAQADHAMKLLIERDPSKAYSVFGMTNEVNPYGDLSMNEVNFNSSVRDNY